MRRTAVVSGVAALVGLGILVSAFAFSGGSDEPNNVRQVQTNPGNDGKADAAAKLKQPALQLPVTQVILFSSGVGHFLREGEVEGSARVDLTFRVEHINDLLKSMVVQDLGGGNVNSVSYDSQDPIEKTLRSFAINLNNNPTFGNVLTQARGEKVEVVMQQTATTQPGTMTGSILGVERQKLPSKDGNLECEVLNLWCADGVRSIKMVDVQRVRFLNPVIENEMKRALDTLALSHDTQKKAVSLTFSGEGKRPVRVGYVTENPIWKTSYRLVIGKEGKPFLQGWAVVENTTDDDWQNVRMALVSGRPISFQMDLYQPLYIPRPVVDLELFASLRPVVYGGRMDGNNGVLAFNPAPPPVNAPMPVTAASTTPYAIPTEGATRTVTRATVGMDQASREAHALHVRKEMNSNLGLDRGVQSVANAGSLGDFFQYIIDHPVSLPRQKSAMLPVINQNAEGTRISIYNETVQAKHPLLGLKFKNTSGLHLMQGPITVFEGSTYAGDARIADLQPNEERLISYAVDLGTEVEPVAKRQPDRLIAVKVNRGLLYATNKVVEEKTWNIKNRSEHDRTVIVEHPYRGADFKLVKPEKPTERTRDLYRFEAKVAKGESGKVEVVEERDVVSTVTLTHSDDETIRFFMQSPVSSPKVKAALEKAVELKNTMALTQREIQQVQREMQIIIDDQGRLRANMANLPSNSAAYKRYLQKFDEQEPKIEQYQDQIRKLQQKEHSERKAYEAFLMSLNVE
jgi:hypothetical protein